MDCTAYARHDRQHRNDWRLYKSKLYQHMVLKEVASDFTDTMRLELLKSLEDESFSYMQRNESGEALKNGNF